MINDDQLENCFAKSFSHVQKKVDERQKQFDYHWLIYPLKQNFYPDYFTLNYVGQSWIVRLISLISSQFGVFGVPFIAMKRFVFLFYDSQDIQLKEKEKKVWEMSYQWLINRLKKAPKEINQWCMVEFFLFVENWMNELNSFFKFRDYERIKKQLNMDSIALVKANSDVSMTSTQDLNRWIMITAVANWLDVVVKDLSIKKIEALEKIQYILSNEMTFEECAPVVSYLQEKKRNIVYECDNTGEIIFDLVLISILIYQGHSITIVAKSGPILNDVTVSELHDLINQSQQYTHLKDAIQNGSLKIISANNFPIVGKYLPLVTEEYKNNISNSDVIWLKGQGNFQTMPLLNHGITQQKISYKKRIIYSFVVKAPIIQYYLQQCNYKKVQIGHPFVKLV